MTHVKDIVGPVMLDMLERNCQALEGALTQLVDAIELQQRGKFSEYGATQPQRLSQPVRDALRHAKVVLGSQP